MRSKYWLLTRIAGLLLLMGQLAACNVFLQRQGPPAQEQIELKMQGMGCIREVPSKVSFWLSDRLDASATKNTFVCLNETLNHFMRFTKGTEVAEQYTHDELRTFLNEILPNDKQISANLMAEIMKLKTVFLGGSPIVMTKKELTQAKVLLTVLEQEALALRGMMRLLLFQATKDNVESSELAVAQRQFDISVANVMQVAKPEASTYSFENFTSLVSEMDAYLGNNRILSQLLRWLPLTQKFKILFLGDRGLAYSQKDWQQILGWSAKAYGLVLEFVYKVRNYDLNSASDMEKLISFGDSVFELIDESPMLKEKDVLSLAALDEVVAEVLGTGLIKVKIPLSVIQESLRKGLMFLVEGPGSQRREAFQVEVITRHHLTTLRFEWNVFALSQKQINQVFLRGADKNRFNDLLQAMDERYIQKDVLRRGRKPGEARVLLTTWHEWQALMNSDFPILWGKDNRLALVKEGLKETEIGFKGMTTANLLRSFTRFILRGYGTGRSTNFWNLQVDELNFSQFERDFREFGQAIHFLDPRTANPAARTLQEANFFTFHGNGDNLLDAREIFEQFNVLTSSGGLLANDLLEMAIEKGCAAIRTDVFGKPYLRATCFKSMFREEFAKVFKSAPGLVNLRTVVKLKSREDEFFENIYSLSEAPHSVPGYVEYGDLRTYTTILSYIETLRLVYDTNNNMRLSEAEIRRAAPRFRNFIAERSPIGYWGAEKAFTCLVFEQEKPDFNFATASCMTRGWTGYNPVSPADLLKVLAVLKKDMFK